MLPKNRCDLRALCVRLRVDGIGFSPSRRELEPRKSRKGFVSGFRRLSCVFVFSPAGRQVFGVFQRLPKSVSVCSVVVSNHALVRADAQAGACGESPRRKELFFTETECFLREDHGLSPRRGRAALVKVKGALRHEEGQALRYFVQSTKVLSVKYLSALSKPP